MANVAEGRPTKSFFVEMITRDISLEDCILDLLDNSIDGARRQLRTKKRKPKGKTPLAGFEALLEIDSQRCRITDNCGGIPRDVAEHYAFRFGRVEDLAPERLGIGLYGVGMKRAIFKLGKVGSVRSRLGSSGFEVKVDVAEWRDEAQDWDFPLKGIQERKPVGTTVDIAPLWDEVAIVVGDPNFALGLRDRIACDYSFLIALGFTVKLNGRRVDPYEFAFRNGSGFTPMRTSEEIAGVTVDIFAGFAEAPPDNVEAEEEQSRKRDLSGWYIACNDRIVIAADKTERTVWGREEFTRWHPQYRGFLGIVRLTAVDPRLLPWTTTKRDVDETSFVFRAAVEKMKSATERCIQYTSSRRGDIDRARQAESKTRPLAALDVPMCKTPLFPRIVKKRKKGTTIHYNVTRGELDQALVLLKDSALTNKEVGQKTFRFFLENAE